MEAFVSDLSATRGNARLSASAPSKDGNEGIAAELDQLPVLAHYGLSVLFVAAAVLLALLVQYLIAPPNLSLIFVLPVVLAATTFGWGPSMTASLASVVGYDFFFTEPRYSLAIASPSDLWATVLLLVIAAAVSTLAAEARRRAVDARQAADQAMALQALAHVVIASRPQFEVVQAAAIALNRMFRAPSVIFAEQSSALQAVASAGNPAITDAEEEAARGALNADRVARAAIYPYDRSTFDFWPIASRSGARFVLGVNFGATGYDRPVAPERLVEVVGAYLAAAPGSDDRPKSRSR
jgi:K+-sensing histidine kinase KdpD